MNIVRRTCMGLGAVLAVALVLTLAAPKTVRAVVATLVTVSNTSSNPVPTLAAEAGRSFTGFASCSSNPQTCSPSAIFTVPPGEIAVIETAWSFCSADPGDTLIGSTLAYSNPSTLSNLVISEVVLSPGQIAPTDQGNDYTGVQNFKAYAGPGPINMVTAAVGPLSTHVSCSYTISGYLVP